MEANSKAVEAMNKFEKWMSEKVKTIYYADNKRMSEAYQRVYQANLK